FLLSWTSKDLFFLGEELGMKSLWWTLGQMGILIVAPVVVLIPFPYNKGDFPPFMLPGILLPPLLVFFFLGKEFLRKLQNGWSDNLLGINKYIKPNQNIWRSLHIGLLAMLSYIYVVIIDIFVMIRAISKFVGLFIPEPWQETYDHAL